MRALLTVIMLLILSLFNLVDAQVSGCKDPAATNYNSAATINDGSCLYAQTSYTPPVKVDPMNSVLTETSGLQMAGNFLWSFNDGGTVAAIYRIDTVSNQLLQTVNLQTATNVDWEDIAFDGTYFYIGDFGNNANGARTDLKIYKFPFNAIDADYITNPTVTVASGQIEIINFSYSDQVPVTPTTANNTKFDCEAMIVDAGKIHLFSKNWIDLNTTHYVINSTAAGTYAATPAETLATGYMVTGSDKVPGQNIIALLGYQTSGFANHFMHLLSDFSSGFFFNGNKRRIDLPSALSMGQAEGICFRNNTYGYISNERITSPVTVSSKLRSFNTENFLPPYVLSSELSKFNVNKVGENHKVSWQFAAPVKDLQIQYSGNRSTFTTLQSYSMSTIGSFHHQPSANSNCYRLSWKTTGGATHYSSVICVKNETKNAISGAVIRNSGELSFMLGGNEAKEFSFRLITTDGKLLTQTIARSFLPGTNQLKFPQVSLKNSIVVLQAINTDETNSVLIRIE